ncbi:COG1426 Predicted transcriptional regulator contains Xre-like HTH domain [Candidatus Nanopelagicaceae bacterium]
MNLGEVLSTARTSARLSLEDLASHTSIRAGLLSEMEKNNFSHCGGDIYARGHLRNIAPKIGLDADQLVDLYNQEHSVESRSINEMLAENSVARVPHEKKNLSWKVPAAFSIAIVLVLAVVQIVITNVNSESPTTPIAVATTSPSPTAEPSDSPSAAVTTSPMSGGVTMSIAATRGNSRIDIVIDGKHVEKGSIFQGETKSFESTGSISVYFSNPAGLDVTVNGELLAPLGGQNEEVRRTFR